MTDSPTTLIASIRFQLSQLGAANGHHTFEHLARHLARERIYSNILPATGPVSAGGDGGRDFQTFRVGLTSASPQGSSFSQKSSGERDVAFACSLETKIQNKIREDVNTILAEGPVDEIVYFCEANVPIGRRRVLQRWAAGLGVELRVFDGLAISEMLAAPDVFWIAQEFLRLPADQMPVRAQEEDWYSSLRARWKGRTPIPVSQADFFEIKAGLRQATFNDDAKPDLLKWLGKMEGFLNENAPRSLVRTALYELAVANFRGRGEMTSQIGRLDDYYEDAEDELGLADLQDAVTLLLYVFGAFVQGKLDTDPERLFRWRAKLADLIADQMEVAPGPGRRCGLLRARGHLRLLPVDPETRPDTSAAYADWRLMLDTAKDAPLFPVEAFSDFLVDALKWGVDQDALLDLAASADEMLQERGGGPAGEKALARALALLDLDQPIAAIRELHKAKRHWFSGERLDDMLRVFLVLANCYQQIGLAYGAKYYAMAAAYMASHEQRTEVTRLLPRALHAVVDAEDAAGNSFGFFTTLLVAINAHVRIDPDPLDPDDHPWINANLSHIAALLGLLRRAQPTLESVVAEPLALWPEPFRAGVLAIVDSPDADWNQGSVQDLWSLLQVAMIDRPFGDLGPCRSARWAALGLTWTAAFDNTYIVTPLAEQFVAALQLGLAAHAGVDLGLVPGDALIEISVDPASEDTALELGRDPAAGLTIKVALPASDRGEEQVKDTVAAILSILRQFSVLDDAVFLQRLNLSMVGEVFVARPYPEMYRYFTDEELFFENARSASAVLRPDLDWLVEAHDDLKWFNGPGPTYDEVEAIGSVAMRYRTLIPMLRFTVARLQDDPEAYARLRGMHDEGLSDWEILGILANVAMNEELAFSDADSFSEETKARALAVFNVAETPETARDPSIFSAEKLDAFRSVYLGAHADSWRLRFPPGARPKGAERFLVGRYRMRDLDIEHDDLFGWQQPYPASATTTGSPI